MKRRILLLTFALAGVALVVGLAIGGCGKKEAQEAQAPAPAPTVQEAPAAAAAAVDTAAAQAAEGVAVHDCAGACGMTNVPEDQLTEIDGKWYCAGCAKKMADEHAGHGHG